jgi:hypothetical protein
VDEYHARAEECAGKAERAYSEELRHDYLTLQRSWLALASSFELGDRLISFSQENQRRRHEFFSIAAPRTRSVDRRKFSSDF